MMSNSGQLLGKLRAKMMSDGAAVRKDPPKASQRQILAQDIYGKPAIPEAQPQGVPGLMGQSGQMGPMPQMGQMGVQGQSQMPTQPATPPVMQSVPPTQDGSVAGGGLMDQLGGGFPERRPRDRAYLQDYLRQPPQQGNGVM